MARPPRDRRNGVLPIALLIALLAITLAAGWQRLGTPLTREAVDESALYYLDDREGNWWPGQAEPSPGFQPVAQRPVRTNFGNREGVIWLRLDLPRGARAPGLWWWVVHNPHLDHVTVLLQREDGQLGGWSGGNRAADRRATVQRHPFPIAPLELEAGLAHRVYMRVESAGAMYMPVSLLRPETFWQADQQRYTLQSLYFGLALGLLAYNILLWRSVRGSVYAHYSALLLALMIAQLANTGLGAQWFWPAHAGWSTAIHNLAIAIASAFALQFVRRFLRTADTLAHIDRGLRATLALWLLTLVLLPWVDLVTAGLVMVPAGLFTIAMIAVAARAAVRAHLPGAIYLAAAWAALMLAGVVFALFRIGLLPYHPLFAHALMVGSAIEIVLLSFALADRIRVERSRRARAEADSLAEGARHEATQRALAEQQRFVAAVTHDLLQPIFALNLALQSLSRHPLAQGLQEPLTQMRSAFCATDNLLNALITLVRLERADYQPDLADVSVQDLIERLDTMYGPIAHNAGLQWRVTPTLAQVHTDTALLERVLTNLIGNALRYTERGGVMLTCRPRREGLLIQVWDTGAGITPETIDRIFQPHERGVNQKAHPQALGLGLAIVRRCALLLGVGVVVRSVPGRGSSFGVLVPWAKQA